MISKSAIELYFRCPRAYKYAYIDGYVGTYSSREIKMGLVGHGALEAKWAGKEPDWAGLFQLHGLEDPVDAMRVRTVVELDDRSPPDGIVAIEREFEAPEYGAKGVLDAETGEAVWEHKFTSSDHSVDDDYWYRLRTDWQAGIYQLVTGKPVIYNVFRIPQQRQGKAESVGALAERIAEDIRSNPARYYGRGKVQWSEESLARLQNDLQEGKALIGAGVYPRSRRCFEFRRKCEYYAACFDGHEFGKSELYQIKTKRERQ